jgi:glycosyltransferase involved in cell wall biosynthesis
VTRTALNLPERYILVQATSDKRKNLARTLDAWRLISKEMPKDLHLVVSGNLGRAHVFGESDVDLDAERLHLTGYVADEHMGPLMAGAEAFVFASLYEGFGLPVIEAMACGTPVITANNSALPEVAGNAALLVDAQSTQMIARAMLDVVSNPALAMKLRHAGMIQARQFSWDNAAGQYVDLFNVVKGLGRIKSLQQAGSLVRQRPYPSGRALAS